MLPSMWRKKPLYTAAGNVLWYSWYGSQYGAPPSPSCKQLKIDQEYDGLYHSLVYTQRTLSTSETHTHVSLLFTTAKKWNRLRGSSAGGWRQKCGTYTQQDFLQLLRVKS